MENKESNNRDLENLLRKQLQEVDQKPGADTWAKIAAQQSTRNQWLQLRHYGLYALPFVLALFALLTWHYYQPAQATDAPAAPSKTMPQHAPGTPVAAAPIEPIESTGDQITGAAAKPNRGAAWSRLNTVPASTVRFQSENGVSYESPVTGTKVSIPAKSLVDAAGRPIQGEVELMLREYRDISDFLASGIPMHYGDERGDYFFNSGGMFEVRVSQNGAPLNMAPGQNYDVLFSPTGELANASLFYLDESDGAWKYRPDPVFNKGNETGRMLSQPPVVGEAVAVRNNLRNNKLPCLPAMPELPVKALADVWVNDGVRVGYELATEMAKMPAWFRKNPSLNNESLMMGLEHGKVRMVRNRDLGELFFPEDLDEVFTELKAFKGCYFFRTTDSVNNTGPAPQALNPDMYWDRIAVRQELGNEVWISLYSDREGLMQFYATLSASIGNKEFDAGKVMAEYQRLRSERQNNFEALANGLRRFMFAAAMFQTQAEWCMSPTEWLTYFEAQRPMMVKRYEALIKTGLGSDKDVALDAWNKWRVRARDAYFTRAEEAMKANTSQAKGKMVAMQYALQISQFGIYNCDQIFRLGARAPDYIYATYQTDTGDRVYAASVSLLERNSRLFFTLPSADKMVWAPGRSIDVIVTDRDGKQYHFPGEQYAQLDLANRGLNNFVVKDITSKTRSPRDWANYLNL